MPAFSSLRGPFSGPFSAPVGWLTSERQPWRWQLLVIAVFVILLRLPHLGNPAIGLDEQYYLVFADKWLNGGLVPYVDIWDRKPVGIFLLYGPAVLLFHNAVVGYQLTADLFVVATCAVIYRIGLMVAAREVAFGAALIYATCPSLMDGAGGQTPVFYNLFVCVAAALILATLTNDQPTAARRRADAGRLALACLLFGLALQVKYICVLESVTLTLIGLGRLAYVHRLRSMDIARIAGLLMLCGLLPTVVAGLAFAWQGAWQSFAYANFVSIFAKNIWRLSWQVYFWRLFTASLFCGAYLPFAAFAVGRFARRFGRKRDDLSVSQRWLLSALLGWILAAWVGGLLMGNPTPHYFMPTAPPLALFAAMALRRLSLAKIVPAIRRWRDTGVGEMYLKIALLIALPSCACFIMAPMREETRGKPSQVYQIADAINRQMHDGRLYVFDYLPVLYYLTQSRLSTIYAFPNHLNEKSEMHALDRDSLTELRAVLDSQPDMIFVRRPFSDALDPTAIDLLERTLADKYRDATHFDAGWQSYDLYVPRGSGSAKSAAY